jgi:MraZ protein
MFLGQFYHSLDDKGRLTIPARFRELLADEGAYLMQGFDQNLMVLTRTSFEAISRRINQTSMTDPTARLLRRLLYSTADRVEVDRVGRILLPQYLRETAGLDGEAVIIGAGEHFEIWSPDRWAAQTEQINDSEANAQRFESYELLFG